MTDAPAADRVAAYTVAAEQAFAGLRALIGQLSGTLILVQARLQRDVADLPEIAGARERWHEAVEQLARLQPPEGHALNSVRLQEAATHIDAALARIAQMRRARADEIVGEAARHLAAAYRLLQSVCDHRRGLTMIDMRDACCNCGKTFAAPTGTSRFERMGT